MNLNNFFKFEANKSLDKIKEMVINKSEDCTILYELAFSLVQVVKPLGLMRLGMILDTMHKCVSKYMVDSNA